MLRVRPRAANRMKKATDPGMIALGIGIAVLLAFSLMIVLFVFPDDKKTGAGNDDNTEVALLESESLMAESGEEDVTYLFKGLKEIEF